MENYDEQGRQSEVLKRLHQMASLSHDQTTDQSGFQDESHNGPDRNAPSADSGRSPTIQAMPEGPLDQYGPNPYTDSLIANGGQNEIPEHDRNRDKSTYDTTQEDFE
jgi:hypothetical protein